MSNLRRVSDCFTSPGAIAERLTLFLAEYDSDHRLGPGGGHEGEGEEIEVMEMSFEDAWSLLENGTIADAKTIILLFYLKLSLG